MQKSLLFTTNDPDSVSGSLFGSFPLSQESIDWLQNRIDKFRGCLRIYPELYETYEFGAYDVEYYDTGKGEEYDTFEDYETGEIVASDTPVDFEKLDHLGQFTNRNFSWTDELNKLVVAGGPPWLVVPTADLPSRSNVRTECHQLVIRNDPTGKPFELNFCFYIKHTDLVVTTTPFTSADVELWASELAEKGAA